MSMNRQTLLIVLAPLALLLLPLIGNAVSPDVHWTMFDFLVGGTLLLGLGLALAVALNAFKTRNSRIAMVVLIVAIFLLTWIELAVGLFGTPLAGS